MKSQVRYISIEFGESGVVPHAPDQTVARAYRDCKDQATLLVDLLRAANLPAHVVLLSVGARQDINGKLTAMNTGQIVAEAAAANAALRKRADWW